MDDDAGRTEAGRLALVLTTEGDTERASQLAETLIDRRIAACVTMQEIRSLYRWEGEVVEAGTPGSVQLVLALVGDGNVTVSVHELWVIP